jgi:uncharacterized protein YbjQ (UPF0145 family)
MSLFHKDGAQAPADPTKVTMSPDAVRRLRELRGDDGKGQLFSSDLSVSEYVVLRNAGFAPAGLVVGSSIFHVGYQRTAWSQNMEMEVLSQAMYSARELAMDRMEEEAAALGADGIVGVRLEVKKYAFADDILEFMAIGTAVRARDGQSYRTPQGKPFTSDLSGQDFALLLSTGHAPAGLVMGSCVYHVAHMSMRQAWKTMLQNTELVAFTQALYDAREIAMERMQAEAKALGAQGIVGVVVHENNHQWEPHVIEYFAIGTAIVPHATALAPPAPTLVMTVDG